MLTYQAPSDKFRLLSTTVSALLFALFLEVFVVIPIEHWRYERAHPQPSWASCTPNGFADMGDGRHFVLWSATSFSPDHRYLLVYDNPCLYAPWGASVRLIDRERPVSPLFSIRDNPKMLFEVRYGGLVIPMWVTNTRVRVTCYDCWPQDATKTEKTVGTISIEYVFLAPKHLRPAQNDWMGNYGQ